MDCGDGFLGQEAQRRDQGLAEDRADDEGLGQLISGGDGGAADVLDVMRETDGVRREPGSEFREPERPPCVVRDDLREDDHRAAVTSTSTSWPGKPSWATPSRVPAVVKAGAKGELVSWIQTALRSSRWELTT
jgi:hypothetical protein